MNLCNKDHQEVCFEGMLCPVCEEINEKEELLKQLGRRDDEISQLKDDNDILEERIYGLQKDVD